MDLRTARAMRQMTQWTLALKTGIHQSRLSLFENGYVTPKDDEKTKIAKALKVRLKNLGW